MSERGQSPAPGKTVLVTNDDGFGAPGLNAMHRALHATGYTTSIVAPRDERSGIGHAFTFNAPLRCRKHSGNGEAPGYAVDGTPSDCVKLAVCELLEVKPDVVVAGMNVGENSGTSGFYSGTVAAAREGALWGIPSFAFSVCEEAGEHVEEYAQRAVEIMERILALESDPKLGGTYYNVNFPGCVPIRCRGVRVTRQSLAFFDDRYRRVMDDCGREGFVIYGEKKDVEPSEDYDSRALINGFATVTPLGLDCTAHAAVPGLAGLRLVYGETR